MRTTIVFINRYILSFLPETRCFSFKRFLYRLQGCKVGINVKICSSARIMGNGVLVIGDNTWIGPETLIISSSKIIIGNDVDIAPRVYIGTGTHEINTLNYKSAGKEINKDVIIGDGCWLGVSCILLPGTFLAPKIIVAAGSVVSDVFEDPNILLAGVPAKIKKFYNEN